MWRGAPHWLQVLSGFRHTTVLTQLSPRPGGLQLLVWEGLASATDQLNSIADGKDGEALVTLALNSTLQGSPCSTTHTQAVPPSLCFLPCSCPTPVDLWDALLWLRPPEPTQLDSLHWHHLVPFAAGNWNTEWSC